MNKYVMTFESFSENNIEKKITEVIKNFLAECEVESGEDLVDEGLCGDLATIIWEQVPEVTLLTETMFMYNYQIDTGLYGRVEPEGEFGLFYLDETGRPYTEKFQSHPLIPYRDIKCLPFHNWVYFNGKHYDMQNPEGVVNFFTMDYFTKACPVTPGSEYTFQGNNERGSTPAEIIKGLPIKSSNPFNA